jgi:hypothetical protein
VHRQATEMGDKKARSILRDQHGLIVSYHIESKYIHSILQQQLDFEYEH